MPRLLELFAGTGSAGKTARRRGWKVLSVDNNPSLDPDICADVLTWNYKTVSPPPDFIWASPPCTTYSIAATWYRHRDPSTGEPWTEDAVEADKILRRTLRIIRHFLSLNPQMRFCIENPRGYMRTKRELARLHRATTTYNNYGFPIAKPTDFWSNFEIALPPCKRGGVPIGRGKDWLGKIARSQGVSGYDQATLLGQVPPRLVGTILSQSQKR